MSRLIRSTRRPHRSTATTTIRTLCATAFACVVFSTALPVLTHAATSAATPAADASPTGAALPAGTVAIVNGQAIAQAQFDEALRVAAATSHQPDTPQLRQAVKNELIVRELFRQNAEKGHYDTRPEVVQAMSAAKVNAGMQLYLKDNVHPEPVTDAQVKARYDQIVASLGKEEYRPRVITVADEATAKTVLKALKSGSAFDALARQYSVAPSKAAGGELPWVSFKTPVTEGNKQGLPLALAQAITQLPVGAVTPAAIPVGEAGEGSRMQYVIVKLDAKRPTQVPAFDQAKDTIRQQLQALALQKASVQFTTELLKNASIRQ